jgi:PAS domain S-box-containing protein
MNTSDAEDFPSMDHPKHGPAVVSASIDELRLLIDAQTEYGVFLLDPEGRVATWNAGAHEIKGYTPEEIIGEHFSRFYTPEDIERSHPQRELELAIEHGRYEEEGWRVRKDGSRFWASVVITALINDDGVLVGFGKVTRDLTTRKLAEERLRANAANMAAANAQLEQFRILVGSVRDYAIFMLDARGHVMTWNTGANHIKGYDEREVIGRHFRLFYTEEDRARNHPEHELEIAAREGRYAEEGWRVRKDGTRFWASVVLTAVRDDHGAVIGYAKVTRDLSERRVAEARVRETAAELARSNAELEHFASIAAHDLSDPLHTIVGLGELLRNDAGERLDGQNRAMLDEIVSGADRLRDMVDALLAYARASQQPVAEQSLPLAAALGRVIEALRLRIAETGATISYDAAGLPAVRGDGAALELVLQNLLANAMKFTRDGLAPNITVTAERVAEMWRITVADEGTGLADADRDRIFGAFERAHPYEVFRGTGLGLALSQRLVARQGGEMGVESTPGEGSRFWFSLPTAGPA